jgi:hypothetical protein
MIFRSRWPRRLFPLVVAAALTCACGGTTTTGTISSVTPSLCIAKAAAGGVCVPGANAASHAVGECVTFTYAGDAGSATNIRDIRPAKAADHPGDCTP